MPARDQEEALSRELPFRPADTFLSCSSDTVKQRAPINQPRSQKAQIAYCLVTIVSVHIVLMPEIYSGTGSRSHSAIYDRQFPILFVVHLLRSDKNGGTCKKYTYTRIPLMPHSPEKLFEGECGICRISGCRITLIIIVLSESLLLELGPRIERKRQQEQAQQSQYVIFSLDIGSKSDI